MPLHVAGEALSLGAARHADFFATGEHIGLDDLTDGERRAVVDPHLGQVFGRSLVGLLEMARLGLVDLAGLHLAEGQLDSGVAVALGGLHLHTRHGPAWMTVTGTA